MIGRISDLMGRAAVLFVCFAGATVAIAAASRNERVPLRTPLAEFPRQIGEWRGLQEQPFEDRVLAVLGVDDYLSRVYVAADRRAGVGLYIGYYQSQRQGDAIHSPLNCIPGAGWEPISNTTLRLSVPAASGGSSASSIEVNRYLIQKGLDRQLVLYWYQSHGRVVANEYWSKLHLIGDAIRLNRTDAALVRVTIPAPEGDAESRAERDAVGFVQTMFPELLRYLPN